jgi:hypothetical protein
MKPLKNVRSKNVELKNLKPVFLDPVLVEAKAGSVGAQYL